MAEAKVARRRPLILAGIAFLAILIPFLSWYFSWMGRPLPDDQIRVYLRLDSDPADIQHALSEVQRRLSSGSASPDFRSQVIALKTHGAAPVRRMVAWVLGHDPHEAAHQALLSMLDDLDLATRRNAAVALSKWKDEAGRPILLGALKPLQVRAPATGVLALSIKQDDPVSTGRDMARIQKDGDGSLSLRPPMNGHVLSLVKKNGDRLQAGELIGTLSPDPASASAALKALFLVGRPEDAPLIRPFAEGRVAHMNRQVQRQAQATLEHLRH